MDVKNKVFGRYITTLGIDKATSSEPPMTTIADVNLKEGASRSPQHSTALKQPYTTSYQLRRPRSEHTHKIPFICTTCGRGFLRKHSWKRREEPHRKKASAIESCDSTLKPLTTEAVYEGNFEGHQLVAAEGNRMEDIHGIGHDNTLTDAERMIYSPKAWTAGHDDL